MIEKTTYLIQRLCAPTGRDNPFNFGGGYKNGGMSDAAMDLIRPLFSFDYMGAAEFEFGAVPKTFSMVLQSFRAGQGCTGTIKIKGHPVYYICDKSDEEYVIATIGKLSAGGRGMFLKEPALFNDVLDHSKYLSKDGYIGWMELDNHFFWFVDEKAFTGTKEMFETYSTNPKEG